MSKGPAKEALDAIMEPVFDAMAELAATVPPEHHEAWTKIVNYIAVSQRVLAKTNPSKIKEAAQTVWMQSFIPPGEKK